MNTARSLSVKVLVCLVLLLPVYAILSAQENPGLAPPVNWTTEQDHADMLRQLGITSLRPGPSGRRDAPDAANTDESIANPFPEWPELLATDDGMKISSAGQWWQQRRPEIVEAFEREVIGRIPKDVPGLDWIVRETVVGSLSGIPVTGTYLVGRVDNTAYPYINVELSLNLVVPETSKTPVPVMVMFHGGNLQQALGNEPLPRFGPPPAPGSEEIVRDPSPAAQLIAAGWGVAWLDPRSIQADNGAGLTRGIIGLVNRGQPRKPDDWGALRAWSWGAARALDYLETLEAVDAAQVGIEGVSRYGKAALVTMAFEPRFATGLIASSGEGGVSPYRRNFGEMVENLTGQGEYHWMAGNFLKYGTAESAFGSMNADDLPVDSHSLIALAAPRATFISYGIPERGDALWLDQQGSYMAAVAASDVFELLGVKGLGTGEHYQAAGLPPVNNGLLDGRLAWRQHDGGHTDAPSWKYFIPWAERELGLAADTPFIAYPRTDPNSHAAHQQLLQKSRAGKIDIYFTGDSITRRWGALDYPGLLANWNSNFHGWNAANFGWGGDRTQNILWRLENGELSGVDPKVIVIQAGTNNIGNTAGDTDKTSSITAGIMAIVEKCRALAPGAEIILTAVFPKRDKEVITEIQAINASLEKLAGENGIRFININDKLSDTNGLLMKQMSSDGLHLSTQGYQVWADALKPIFSGILGLPAATDKAPPATGNPAVTSRG